MITPLEITKTAELARLAFDEAELTLITKQLENVMVMIDQLNEVDSDQEINDDNVNSLCQPLRKDEIKNDNNINELLANVCGNSATLAKEIKCFVVPKVVE